MTKDQIKLEAGKFCKEFDIVAGWTQEQHVGFVHRLIVAEVGIEGAEEKEALLTILGNTCNPSAFRQVLENADILTKSEKGAKAAILANKYV